MRSDHDGARASMLRYSKALTAWWLAFLRRVASLLDESGQRIALIWDPPSPSPELLAALSNDLDCFMRSPLFLDLAQCSLTLMSIAMRPVAFGTTPRSAC